MDARDAPSPMLDGPAAEIVNGDGRADVVFVCEHASAEIPNRLNDLGIAPHDRFSHAVWDIGAGGLAWRLARALDAPLVLGTVSRTVYDLNRSPEAPDAIPVRSETIDIPGNRDLSPAERERRVREVHDPFRETLTRMLDERGASAMVTIHSFSPIWFGRPRKTEIGLLHDADSRLAEKMLAAAAPGRLVELNKPYSAADGVTHTLARHAVPRGIANVMIEVRNDLLGDDAAIEAMADTLLGMLRPALDGEDRAA